MNKSIPLILLYFIFINLLNAQVNFNSTPQDKQLIARDISSNTGLFTVDGVVSTESSTALNYDSWGSGEPNNSPSPENAAEIINYLGYWNDANANNSQSSYVEYDGLITTLGNFSFLGQYNGHSYFRNPSNLSWQDAKLAAENAGGYLASLNDSSENSTVASFNYFRGWIGLYQNTNSPNYIEPSGGWEWLRSSGETFESYDSIILELYKNGAQIESFTENLQYTNSEAGFQFNITISSELSSYDIKIYTEKNGNTELIKTVNEIVCGDVFVIQGQSNAAAVQYSGSSNPYQDNYIRVYSGGYTDSNGLLNDDQWYYGQGDGNENSGGNTGQWGMALAKMVLDELQVPIAIFNGAHGGQPVSFFQAAEDYTSSTSSNYGRLYYRLNKSGLKNAVRGVLWSQGEADSFNNGLNTNSYKIAFNTLKNSWLNDYPNIEKIYIFQTRDCNCGTSSSGRLQIKEAQRQLAVEYENINIMGTTGMTPHSDYCHYPFVNGYETFALRIFKPLMRDLYGYTYNEEIDAPMILSANLSDSQTLVIQTDSNNLTANTNNNSSLLSKISNDFVLTNANGVNVNSFEFNGGSLILGLSGNPGSNPTISFYGQYSELSDNITNSSGIELVCFSYFPITGGSGGNGGIPADTDKKTGAVFVEDGNQNVASGRIYASSARGASRNGNGNSNGAFGNIADWSVDLVVSEETPEGAANRFGGFRDNQHPLYQGSDALTQNSTGMGALGWGSFAANVYNRASGVGSTVFGFNNIAGRSDAESLGITGDDIGQAVFGYGSRATGNVSFAAGQRSTASGSKSVSMGNFNYATGDSTIALGKENWAEGASTVAIGFKNHAAGGGSTALGQENVSWGTTNFTSGYQNTAGDTNAAVGTAGSATAMGKYNTASGRSSFAGNRGTKALNQASASLGLGTTADNFGMLAIGVNNIYGVGDTSIDPDNYGGYYYADGQYTGTNPGVAFVIGNGDVNASNGLAGNNPSNAFVVNYDGSATLSGELTINSDMRLKSNITSLSGALAKLLEIDGKSYTMKSNDKEAKIGLLAQDVEKVLPELVKEADDKQGTLSVNYQGLIPVLINAIKEQQEQLKEIKENVRK